MPPTLKHLAELILQIDDKRKLCEELYKQVEQLAISNLLVVEGELSRIKMLQALQDDLMSRMQYLRDTSGRDEVAQTIKEIEDLLSDVKWELADEIKASLAQKAELLTKYANEYETKLAEWQKTSNEIESALNEAKKVRAPVRQYEIEYTKFKEQVRQSARAFEESDFILLQKLLNDLRETPTAKNPDYVRDINNEIEASQQFVRQADLLLLQSPLDLFKRYPYTVLLRTPSELGTHGINIQGSSTVVRQDREEMRDLIKQISAKLSQNLRGDYVWADKNATINIDLTTPPATDSDQPAASNDSHRGFEFDENVGTLAGNNTNELINNVGDLMFRLLMPEPMQPYISENQNRCSITITTNDLELPWELMSYQNTFLCLERPVSRMPMGHAFPRVPQPIRQKTKLRFLLICSNPTGNLPGAEREVETIKNSLKEQWHESIEVEVIERKDASGRKLNEILRKGSFDVIHYAGHAYFDRNDADLSGLLLHEEEHFLAQKIRRLTEGRPLVFLNACESAQTANEKSPLFENRYLQKPAEGLASAFIYGGALGCIGSLWAIYDKPAADFAISFYNYVLKGYMIGEAMRQARLEIKKNYPNQITWAAFVLYGDPTFRL